MWGQVTCSGGTEKASLRGLATEGTPGRSSTARELAPKHSGMAHGAVADTVPAVFTG